MTQNCTTIQSSIFLFSFQENKMQIMGTTWVYFSTYDSLRLKLARTKQTYTLIICYIWAYNLTSSKFDDKILSEDLFNTTRNLSLPEVYSSCMYRGSYIWVTHFRMILHLYVGHSNAWPLTWFLLLAFKQVFQFFLRLIKHWCTLISRSSLK